MEIVATHALGADGKVLEFFDPEWVPLAGKDQAIEPGHLAEWIYLSDKFAQTVGTPTDLPLAQMWRYMLGHRLPSGFLPGVAGGKTRCLWPQIKFLNASMTMQRAGQDLALETQPAIFATLLWASYMTTPVKGGWYDFFDDPTGVLTSINMPASTFYHIDLAIKACLSLSD